MPKTALMVLIGLGTQYHFGESVSLYVEGDHRFTNNEYLDGFSKAANPQRHEASSTLVVGFVFRLGELTQGYSYKNLADCPIGID